jgi:hypothetical protein
MLRLMTFLKSCLEVFVHYDSRSNSWSLNSIGSCAPVWMFVASEIGIYENMHTRTIHTSNKVIFLPSQNSVEPTVSSLSSEL